MTKDEIQKSLEEAKKQILGLQDHIQNLERKLDECEDGEIPEFPVLKYEEDCWFVDEANGVEYSKNCGCYENTDFNVFHTPEMAQEYAEKCKLIAMMLHCKWHLCPDYTPDFTDADIQKWFIAYNASVGCYDYICARCFDRNTVCFDSPENARKAADWLNRRIKQDEQHS